VKRRLFNLAATISVVLCLATVALWCEATGTTRCGGAAAPGLGSVGPWQGHDRLTDWSDLRSPLDGSFRVEVDDLRQPSMPPMFRELGVSNDNCFLE
jgi:hypothetical protein